MSHSFTDSSHDDSYLIFDIETVSIDQRRENLSSVFRPSSSNCSAPDGSMTESEIRQFVAAESPNLQILQEMLQREQADKNRKGVCGLIQSAITTLSDPIPKKYSVLPEMQRVVCIAMEDTESGATTVLYDEKASGSSEAEMLEEFWRQCVDLVPCGWGIRNFDLPVLMLASDRLGVTPTRLFDMRRGIGFVDLMQARFGHEMLKLRETAIAAGFPLELDSQDALSGGHQVQESWDSGDFENIVSHCSIDLARTSFLFGTYHGVFF